MVSAIIGVVGLGLVVGACVLNNKHCCSEAYYKYVQNNKQAPPQHNRCDWFIYF